jgi:hypothetical protein
MLLSGPIKKVSQRPTERFNLRPQGLNQGQTSGNQAVGNESVDEEPEAFRHERAIA